MPVNARDFQISITRELDIIKNRVRDLIGDRHWGEEGRFKEAILKNVLRRFLPINLSVGTGFVINTNDSNRISRQLDIVIYDNTYPILFSEGDFIITTSQNVKAIIEVKSTIRHTTLERIINEFDEAINMLMPFPQRRQFSIANNRQTTNIFFGLFAFEFVGHFDSERVDSAIINSEYLLNHISLGPNFFIRKWNRNEGTRLVPRVNSNTDFYNLYEIENLSFSYFIGNLIDIVSGGLNDRSWFAFPIEGTKERYRTKTVRCR